MSRFAYTYEDPEYENIFTEEDMEQEQGQAAFDQMVRQLVEDAPKL
jgi:hypothetical protein